MFYSLFEIVSVKDAFRDSIVDEDIDKAVALYKKTKEYQERREKEEFQRAQELSRLENSKTSGTVEILSSDDEDKELDSKLNIQQNMIEEDRKLAIQIQK